MVVSLIDRQSEPGAFLLIWTLSWGGALWFWLYGRWLWRAKRGGDPPIARD
jgi:hypothetical protein